MTLFHKQLKSVEKYTHYCAFTQSKRSIAQYALPNMAPPLTYDIVPPIYFADVSVTKHKPLALKVTVVCDRSGSEHTDIISSMSVCFSGVCYVVY